MEFAAKTAIFTGAANEMMLARALMHTSKSFGRRR
jgi:hypothetical protein